MDECPVCTSSVESIYEIGQADPVLMICGRCGWGSRVHPRRPSNPIPLTKVTDELKADVVADLLRLAEELE